jgi:hypothetical protein
VGVFSDSVWMCIDRGLPEDKQSMSSFEALVPSKGITSALNSLLQSATAGS